jgi:NAD+ kinase
MVVHRPHAATSVVVDGDVAHRLDPDDRVRVTRALPSFQLVEVSGHGYYRTLREKLGWGGGLRPTQGS